MTPETRAFFDDVIAGLSAKRKQLSCRYFYDEAGSQLFEEICALDEYYLTRAEREILERRKHEIAALAPEGAVLVELGSGSAQKTRLLIEALLEKQGRLRYVPIDVSRSMLEESTRALLASYRALEVEPIAADYRAGLVALKKTSRGPNLILWLGSNIGNFDRPEAAAYLSSIREVMAPNDAVLIGVDLRKYKAVLEAAYDDALGVTAEFNKNILRHINRVLGGNFDVDRFRHRAVYAESAGRIEMYLDSAVAQRVRIADIEFAFEAGEAIHTENSYKYDASEIHALADTARLELESLWTDGQGRFADVLLRRPR
jgi:dimethylhistidine N-methyltransferase